MQKELYYIYNVNFKNEYLQTVQGTIPPQLIDCATYISLPNYQVNTIPIFNKKQQKWDIISDYRNQIIFNKKDSLIKKKQLSVGDIEQEYTISTPPDLEKSYRFIDNNWINNFQVTKKELNDFTYEQKCNIAYTGVNVINNNSLYVFETDQNSITMCNSQAIALQASTEQIQIKWKVYKNNQPVLLTLTKNQFLKIFSFGMQMINQAFALQGSLNTSISNLTDEQLKNQAYINTFKNQTKTKFNNINKNIIIQENIQINEL